MALIFGISGCAESSPSTVGDSPVGSPLQLVSLQGESVEPFENGDAKAFVFVFTCTDCPIANRYATEVQRLSRSCAEQGVEFLLVYPNPDDTPEKIQQHLDQYRLTCQAVRDEDHSLVTLSQATVTPEAALFDSSGKLVYHGRIDNRYVDFGHARSEPTRRDLQDAVEALLRGDEISESTTEAIGCSIVGAK